MATVVGVRIRNNKGPLSSMGKWARLRNFGERLEHKKVVEINAVANLADILQGGERQ